jgi:hypothetical protein
VVSDVSLVQARALAIGNNTVNPIRLVHQVALRIGMVDFHAHILLPRQLIGPVQTTKYPGRRVAGNWNASSCVGKERVVRLGLATNSGAKKHDFSVSTELTRRRGREKGW